MHHDNPLIISFYIEGNDSGDLNDYYDGLNGTMSQLTRCQLPHGSWEVSVNHQLATCQGFNIVSDTVTIEPRCGTLLRKLRVSCPYRNLNHHYNVNDKVTIEHISGMLLRKRRH